MRTILYYLYNRPKFNELTDLQSATKFYNALSELQTQFDVKLVQTTRKHYSDIRFRWQPKVGKDGRAGEYDRKTNTINLSTSHWGRRTFMRKPRIPARLIFHEIMHWLGAWAKDAVDQWGHSADPTSMFNINLNADFFNARDYKFMFSVWGKAKGFKPTEWTYWRNVIRMHLSELIEIRELRNRFAEKRNASIGEERKQLHSHVIDLNKQLKEERKLYHWARRRLAGAKEKLAPLNLTTGSTK